MFYWTERPFHTQVFILCPKQQLRNTRHIVDLVESSIAHNFGHVRPTTDRRSQGAQNFFVEGRELQILVLLFLTGVRTVLG
jgi:hypothetical protein